MKCHSVERKVSAYIDGLLSGPEREEMDLHLARCARCVARSEQLQQLRNTLHQLPSPAAPEGLGFQLRVLASRELSRRKTRTSVISIFAHWLSGVRLRADNLMRPLALPFAGGLVSTVVLFSMLVPTFSPMALMRPLNDVPTVLSTDPTLMSATSFGLTDEEVVVDLVVDEQGRMTEYSIPAGQVALNDPELRRSVENTLLLAQFKPATMFGVPVSGKTRITLRRSHVEVRG